MHPLFTQDLTQLSDDELHKRHGEVLKKINQAGRLGYADAAFQLQMMLDHFHHEISRRNEEKLKKLDEKGTDFSDYINIG